MLNSLDHHELLVFWVQLLVLYATARLLGYLARRLSLPSVIGELSAGLLLGPSIFGVVWSNGFDWFLPNSEVQSAMLLAVSWFSAAFLLVVAGFETDLELIRRLGRAAALVTAGSLLVPLTGGLIVGGYLPQSFYGPEASTLVFTLFIATSVAVSALAVVAKILGDLGLLRRDVGQITIAVGMANDLIGWMILGVIAGLAASGELSAIDAGTIMLGLAAFLVAALTIGQRVVDIGLRAVRRQGKNLQGALTVAVGAMLVLGVITQWIGVEAVLGTFVAGVLLARSRYQQIEGEHVIEDLTSVLFAPLFFATAGLRLDLGLLRGSALGWALVLLAVALVLKFLGSLGGARLAGLTLREGLVLGAGLNARGALEIIIASVGLSLGVLNQTSFTVIVMIPLVTSLFASVGVRVLSHDLEGSVAERERLELEEALERNLLVRNSRILLPSGTDDNSIVAAQIVHFAWPESLAATLISVQGSNGDPPDDLEPLRNVLHGREVEVKSVEAGNAIASVVAESRLGYGVVAVGTVADPGHGVFFSPMVDELLGQVDLPVVIVRKARNLPGRLPGAFGQALVPVVASASSRAAEELAANFASRLGTRLMLSHVVYRPRSAMVSAGRLLGRLRDVAFPEDSDVAERVLARAHEHAVEVRASADTEIRFASSAAEEIVRHANEIEADLIVLGAQLRNLDGRPSLGPNTEHVLEHAPQTVVVVVMPDRRPE
ncbi:MAG: universal stress protein [Actinomycetia bacterium]|nr:universal stress protein [Actinomycetes bacterium]MCP4228030.1 universal stress protein [Actinomycetes bacterium]MCP5035262.1 universal stress protein [Actinomycetes bacterium]